MSAGNFKTVDTTSITSILGRSAAGYTYKNFHYSAIFRANWFVFGMLDHNNLLKPVNTERGGNVKGTPLAG